MANLDQEDCDQIAETLNQRPRKRHGFNTPNQAFLKNAPCCTSKLKTGPEQEHFVVGHLMNRLRSRTIELKAHLLILSVGVGPEFDCLVGGTGLGGFSGVHRWEERGISRGSTTSCHLGF
jgi:hypothetical protein